MDEKHEGTKKDEKNCHAHVDKLEFLIPTLILSYFISYKMSCCPNSTLHKLVVVISPLTTSRRGHRDSEGCKFRVLGGEDLRDIALFLPSSSSSSRSSFPSSLMVRVDVLYIDGRAKAEARALWRGWKAQNVLLSGEEHVNVLVLRQIELRDSTARGEAGHN